MKFLLLFALMHSITNMTGGHVEADFWTQYGSATPRMTIMVLATPMVGTALGFTSNTRDMTLSGHPGITFKSAPGITPSSIEMALDEPANMELTGIYQDSSFTQEDVSAGKWNGAMITVFIVCWDNTALGEFILGTFKTGRFKDYQTFFNAEARGQLSLLSSEVGISTQRTCRTFLGSDLCTVDLNGTVTIDSVVYNIRYTNILVDGTFLPSDFPVTIDLLGSSFTGTHPPDGFFANGKITGVGGNNDGISREIADSQYVFIGPGPTDYIIKLYMKRPFPYTIAGAGPPEYFTVTRGCLLTVEACMVYNNIKNFRGEPYIPGIESVRNVPNQ